MNAPAPGPAQVFHATAVVLGATGGADAAGETGASGFGVMIQGPSGSGKSALALQLIALGARLVADDRTRVEPRADGPWALAPDRLAGAIEARGIGLLALPFAAAAPLRLIVDMGTVTPARLPEPVTRQVLGHDIRCIQRVDGPHFAGSIVALSTGGWWHDG